MYQITRDHLKDLMVESGFVYPEKLKAINLDVALDNIIKSYYYPMTTGKIHIPFTSWTADGVPA